MRKPLLILLLYSLWARSSSMSTLPPSSTGGPSKTTWFIDGPNLLAARGTPRDVDDLQRRLGAMDRRHQSETVEIFLVMDGPKQRTVDTASDSRRSSELKTLTIGSCTKISLSAALPSADDYIHQQVLSMAQMRQSSSVHVVTADRELSRRVQSVNRLPTTTTHVLKSVVNPVTFWKRYIPRWTATRA
jgi:hypothetical protein